MTRRRLIVRELAYRKANAAGMALAVAAAAAAVVAGVLLLRAFDADTERLAAEKEADLRAQMGRMEDEYRRITKRMGFNVVILPREQNLADFYSEHYAQRDMPEEYARRLAEATNVATIRHILPMLQSRVEWPEQKRRILLAGVQGAAPWSQRAGEEPMLKPVPPGSVAVGYELHRSLGLAPGAELTLMGRKFLVSALHPERGTVDDVTVWVDLKAAQQLLGREGRINSIVALECQCAFADLPKIRREIEAIIPDTQVIELAGKALARAEARHAAERNAREAIERENVARAETRRRREDAAAVLVPLVVLGCAFGTAVLAWQNARERRVEVAVLRALGMGDTDILAVFLGKSLIVGAAGGAAGLAAGVAAGTWLSGVSGGLAAGFRLAGPGLLCATAALAPLVAALAAWVPALRAAGEDPADVLREA